MPDENGLPLRSDVKKPLLGKKSYDIAKDVVTIWIPSLATFYAGLALVLGLPFSAEVVGVCGLLTIFLGSVLKISSNRYNNQPVDYAGELIANDPDPNHETFRLELNRGLVELASNDEIRLKVVDLLPDDATG